MQTRVMITSMRTSVDLIECNYDAKMRASAWLQAIERRYERVYDSCEEGVPEMRMMDRQLGTSIDATE